MPQTKQKNVHPSDKQAVESLQGEARRAKFRKPYHVKKRKKKPLNAEEKRILAYREKQEIKEGTMMGAMQGGFAGLSAYQGEKFDSRGNKRRATGAIGGAIVGGLLGRRAEKKRIKKEKEISERMNE